MNLRLATVILLCLASCSADTNDIHETRFIMGTLVEFTVSDVPEELAKTAIRDAANEMQRIDDTFTIYGNAANTVKQFNASIPGTPVPLPAEVANLLRLALKIHEESRHAFHPFLGKLNLLWGFSLPDPPDMPPDAEKIHQGIPPENCIHPLPTGWVRNDIRCLLDFGAIAKGYAVDRGIEVLRRHGIHDALINAGGDIRVIGRHGNRPWRIGIRHPRKQGELLGTVELTGDVSIVSSGDYERFFIYRGKRYHHILDPHTGMPSEKCQSTTVIAPNATLADAWSTALFVLGPQGIPLIEKRGMSALLVDAQGNILVSEKMRKIFRPL